MQLLSNLVKQLKLLINDECLVGSFNFTTTIADAIAETHMQQAHCIAYTHKKSLNMNINKQISIQICKGSD